MNSVNNHNVTNISERMKYLIFLRILMHYFYHLYIESYTNKNYNKMLIL